MRITKLGSYTHSIPQLRIIIPTNLFYVNINLINFDNTENNFVERWNSGVLINEMLEYWSIGTIFVFN